MPKITKRSVEALTPDVGGKELLVFDDELSGFAIRVFPSGRKSYLVQYRDRQGRTRRYTIGSAEVFTPLQAREEAIELLRAARKGIDPSDARAQERQALTVAALADLYLVEGPLLKPQKRASSWATDRSGIERHIKPLLGRKIARTLVQSEVKRFLGDVAAGRTAFDEKASGKRISRPRGRIIVEGGPGTANRALAVLGAMMSFAVDQGIAPSNPVPGVRPLPLRKRDRFLTGPEIANIGQVLTAPSFQTSNPAATAAIRLLLFTGARRGEITGLRWEHVDWEARLLRLPKSKTGAKTVPLPAPAIALLRTIRNTWPKSEWVLPASRGKGPVVGVNALWRRVRKAAGLDDVRLHDLRHTFASTAVASGASLYLVGKVLGHSQARTTEKYAHVHDDPIRAVAEATAKTIAARLDADQSPEEYAVLGRIP